MPATMARALSAVTGASRTLVAPRARRIPRTVARTGSASVGEGYPAILCAYRIAAARRAIVEAFRQRSASAARKAATLSGEAGTVGKRRSVHHRSNSA
jgi:hypothetical protein